MSYGRAPKVAGAYDGRVLETPYLPNMRHERCVCPPEGERSFARLLDETEKRAASAVRALLAGQVDPAPPALRPARGARSRPACRGRTDGAQAGSGRNASRRSTAAGGLGGGGQRQDVHAHAPHRARVGKRRRGRHRPGAGHHFHDEGRRRAQVAREGRASRRGHDRPGAQGGRGVDLDHPRHVRAHPARPCARGGRGPFVRRAGRGRGAPASGRRRERGARLGERPGGARRARRAVRGIPPPARAARAAAARWTTWCARW